jgi:hypothetical protein
MKIFTFVAIVFSIVYPAVELPQLLLHHLLHPKLIDVLGDGWPGLQCRWRLFAAASHLAWH